MPAHSRAIKQLKSSRQTAQMQAPAEFGLENGPKLGIGEEFSQELAELRRRCARQQEEIAVLTSLIPPPIPQPWANLAAKLVVLDAAQVVSTDSLSNLINSMSSVVFNSPAMAGDEVCGVVLRIPAGAGGGIPR